MTCRSEAECDRFNESVRKLEVERDAAVLQNEAMRKALTQYINVCLPGGRYPANDLLMPGGLCAEKPNGLDAHGNIEPGLRCSKSGCDDLATCKKCFGCKEHCTEKRIDDQRKCWLCGEPATQKIGAEPRCEKHV